METETQNLLREAFEKQYKDGIEMGKKIEKQRQIDEQLKLQKPKRNYRKIFRIICWIRGHKINPVLSICEICRITQEELMRK